MIKLKCPKYNKIKETESLNQSIYYCEDCKCSMIIINIDGMDVK